MSERVHYPRAPYVTPEVRIPFRDETDLLQKSVQRKIRDWGNALTTHGIAEHVIETGKSRIKDDCLSRVHAGEKTVRDRLETLLFTVWEEMIRDPASYSRYTI